MKCGIKLTVDFTFKLTFGTEENKHILKHLINSVLADVLPSPITSITLLNPYGRQHRTKSKLTIFDIKARDDEGREYIIEVQLFKHANFPERLFYYGAKEYAGQLQEGDDYSNLKPIFVICITEASLFENGIKAHSRFRLVDESQGLTLTPTFEIHIIELNKFPLELADLKTDEERWIYFIRNAEEYDSESLPEALSVVPEIQDASGVLTMVAHSPVEREEYEAELKAKRDENARLKYAIESGRSLGLYEGQLNEARKTLFDLGQLFIGPLSEAQRSAIESEENLESLREWILRMHRSRSWDEILSSQPCASQN